VTQKPPEHAPTRAAEKNGCGIDRRCSHNEYDCTVDGNGNSTIIFRAAKALYRPRRRLSTS
jgi:hypothetical protein